MAYPLRRRFMKRKRARPRRYGRGRKPGIPRMNALSIKPRNRIHFHTFRVQLTETQDGGIYNEVTSGVPQARSNHIAINLDMFPHSASFKRLYQQYKICKLKLEFVPVNTRGRILTPGSDSNIPTFTTLINRTSASFPGTLNQALSVPYAKQTNAGKYHTHYFTPVTYDSVYRALPNTSNALNPEYAQYLSVEYSNVNHHGISWVMSESGNAWNTQAFEYRTVVTAYVAFKGIKVDTTAA